MTMATTTSDTSATGSVEALKQVKATEVEWDARLTAARRDSAAALDALRAHAAVAIRDAQAEADQERVAHVGAARAETDREVEAILADGRAAAERAQKVEGRSPAEKKDAILDVVLGSLAHD